MFDSLCILSSSPSAQHSKQSVILDHHLYNQLTDTWVKQASKSQPFINVATTLSPTDYATLGFSTSLSSRSTTLSVMANTGSQSCLARINAINHLGITAKDLIPVTMQMYAASNVGINILGTTILQFSGHSSSDQLLETHHLTYVTDCSSKLFFSREACSEFGMIPRHFPTISEVMPLNNATSGAAHTHQPNATASLSTPPSNVTGLTAPCSCPKLPTPTTDAKHHPLPSN